MQAFERLQQATRNEATVPVWNLRTDGGTQYRSRTEDETVEQYKLLMKDGALFPPIDTVFDGQNYWVYDGFHRLAAISRIGKPTIAVRFIEGDKADAQLLALTANAQHGLPRDVATKRKIGLAAIANPLLENCSAYEMSKITGLSAPFIQSLQDPDIKKRQQIARDRAATKRIKREVTNLITTLDSQRIDSVSTWMKMKGSSPSTNQISTEITTADVEVGPSEDEMKASELAQQADMEMLYKLLDSDQPLQIAHAEITRLNLAYAQLDLRFKGLMNERNEAVRQIKTEQRRCERIQRELKAYKKPKSELRIRNTDL